MYVIFNSRNEFFAARKLLKIIHLRFQDAPPALHRSIVKTSAYTVHTLEHTIDNVPIFAYGDAADFFDGKAVENTEIAKQFAKAIGVDDFGDVK